MTVLVSHPDPDRGALILAAAPPLDRNPAAVYLAGLASGSRPAMGGALRQIAELLTNGRADWPAVDWAALRYQHTAAIRARLADLYRPATANRMLCALRRTLRAAWQLGQITADEYHRAAAVGNIAGSTLPKGRALPAGEIVALMDACAADSSAAGARDAALLALLYGAGLRRAEVCALALADFDPAAGVLRVQGKGQKEREVPIPGGAAAALADWLGWRGAEPGPLFCPVNKAGRVTVRWMHPEAVYSALRKRAKAAGVGDLSPHDFRRTFVSDLLDRGADIATVQRLAGHASVTTTARYDRRGEVAKRRAVDLLHVPYQGRRADGKE